MGMHGIPIWLGSKQEFQKATSDPKSFQLLLNELFAGNAASTEKYSKMADRIFTAINDYLPKYTGLPKELVQEAMREELVMMAEAFFSSGKVPKQFEARLALAERLSPEQAAMHEKYMEIFRAHGFLDFLKKEMGEYGEPHTVLLASILVKYEVSFEKQGVKLSKEDSEFMVMNAIEGVTQRMNAMREQNLSLLGQKPSRRRPKDEPQGFMSSRASTDGGEKGDDYFDDLPKRDRSGFNTQKAAAMLKAVAGEIYAYSKIYWETARKPKKESSSNRFLASAPKINPAELSFTLSRDLENNQKETDRQKERDREIGDKFA